MPIALLDTPSYWYTSVRASAFLFANIHYTWSSKQLNFKRQVLVQAWFFGNKNISEENWWQLLWLIFRRGFFQFYELLGWRQMHVHQIRFKNIFYYEKEPSWILNQNTYKFLQNNIKTLEYTISHYPRIYRFYRNSTIAKSYSLPVWTS